MNNKTQYVFLAIILIMSFFVIFNNYNAIAHYTWDEAYFSATVEKYNHNVAQMEAHPPLAKLFMHLGVIILNPNEGLDTQYMTTATRIYSYHDTYSFAGMRLFPALFAMLSPLILFLLFMLLRATPWYAFCFTLLFIFDNALIAHSRAALIEPIQYFFAICAITYFTYVILKTRKIEWTHYVNLSAIITLAIMCKINAVVLVCLLAFLLIYEVKEKCKFNEIHKNISGIVIKLLQRGAISLLIFLVFFVLIWQIHFSIGSEKPADTQAKFFSPEYLKIIEEGRTSSPSAFMPMMRDTLKYMIVFQKFVPTQASDAHGGEFGSKPIGWPIGLKPIKYLENTQPTYVQKLYMIPNLITWAIGLIGLILSMGLIVQKKIWRNLFSKKEKNTYILLSLLVVYFTYMCIVFTTPRVLYLFHYFLPLMISLVCSYIVFSKISHKLITHKSKKLFIISIVIIVALLLCFIFFSPLTYFTNMSPQMYEARKLIAMWEMT